MVTIGVTEMLPEPSPTGTGMPPGSNVPLVALLAVQFRVAVHPTEISPVETRLPVGAAPTVTVALAVSWDAGPQGAVTVKV